MDTLRWLVGLYQTPPHSVSEDDVYPVHILDGAKEQRVVLSWIMRFNDVLDVKKLHDALSSLLEIGDWRKLGGRLRQKSDGKLEIHVPRLFTADRPALGFSHHTFSDTSMEDHPAACHFPQATDSPSIQPISVDLQPFSKSPDFPATIEEMIRQDIPQLSLHITSFNDETLVALTWPHTMMDATGYQALLRSWSLVLAGRKDEVPPMLGAREDVLSEVGNVDGEGQKEELMLERKRLTGLNMATFIFRFIWNKHRNPVRERRMIFLPKDVYVRLQTQAYLEATEATQGSDQKCFVSEGDILTAWITRTIASSEPKLQPVTIASLFDTRYRLARLLESGSVYAQNMALVTYTILSSQLVRGSVGQIALAHRQHLVEQTTEQQTLSFMRIVRQDIRAHNKARLLFGAPDSLPILFNNLTKAEIIKAADFSAAVVRQGGRKESSTNPPGTMITYYNQKPGDGAGGANCFFILGKDYGEGYWLMGDLLPRAWTKIEEDLQKM